MTTIAARMAKIERQNSGAAVWSQRLAVFAVPYLVLVVAGHRFGAIDTKSSLWLLAFGMLILVAALVCGAKGFYDLWTTGQRGGLKAARGVVLAALLFSPFLFQGFKTFVLPPLYDISTDLESPPEFENALEDRTDSMNVIAEPTDVTKRLQLRAYPKVVARRYPLGSGRIFREVAELMKDRDWVVLTSDSADGEAAIDDEGSGLVAKPVTDSRGLPLRIPLPTSRPTQLAGSIEATIEPQQVSPIGRAEQSGDEEATERYVEAVATSLIFGFESDVVIRIVEEEDGSLVDMRSNSRWGPHDLGSNAARILSFMEDLDAALQGLSQ